MAQRPGNTHPAASPADPSGMVSLMKLKNFAQEAERELDRTGQEDAAFYFGQLADYITQNPGKGLDESVTRILGL